MNFMDYPFDTWVVGNGGGRLKLRLVQIGNRRSRGLKPERCGSPFVRSPHAHAQIQFIDIAAALASPGVLAVLLAATISPMGSRRSRMVQGSWRVDPAHSEVERCLDHAVEFLCRAVGDTCSATARAGILTRILWQIPSQPEERPRTASLPVPSEAVRSSGFVVKASGVVSPVISRAPRA
jgi:hypothetical protein